jgi:hypothetical protein
VRDAIFPPESYLSNQFNASIQIYPFEPYNGNIEALFQRTLLQDRIDPRFREENVANQPRFGKDEMPGAQIVLFAVFAENRVALYHPGQQAIHKNG